MKPSYEELTRRLIEMHLVPHFGSRDLREINEEDVLEYVRIKLEANLSPKFIRNGLSIMRRVYNLLQRDGRVGRNPAARIGELMRRVDRRLSEEVRVTDSWTQDEVQKLLSVAWEHERRFYPALATLFYTGLRRGEVLGLKWSDVDFDRGRLHVRRAIVNRQVTTPKSGRGRYVSMAQPLASLLLELLGERRQTTLARGWPETPEWLFCSQTGGFWDQDHFERSWRRVRRRAQKDGVRPLRLHCTRHTYATLALASGKSLRWVADQLGHADPALTLRTYSHAIPDAEEDLSFLDFGGPGRHYTAPPSEAAEKEKSGSGVTDRNRSDLRGAPGTTRTCGLQVRNLALYPTELRARANGSAAWNLAYPVEAGSVAEGAVQREPVAPPQNP